MAISSNNFATYLEQYLKTVNAKFPNAKLTANYAIHVDRYQVHCGKCDVSITANRPSDTTVDYSVQEFIKAHKHCSHEFDAWGAGKCSKCGVQWTPDICVHEWVKVDDYNQRCSKCNVVKVDSPEGKIPAAKASYTTYIFGSQGVPAFGGGIGLTNLQTPSGPIDDSPENAAIIQKQMAAYDEEMKTKLAVKIAQVQAQSKLEKAGVTIGSGINAGFSGLSPAEQEAIIAKEKAKELALKNILQLMNLKDVNALLEGKIGGHHATPEVKKSKPLSQPTGRKFR